MADTVQIERKNVTPERVSTQTPERTAEVGLERAQERVSEPQEKIVIQVPVQAPSAPMQRDHIETQLHREIEKVLQEDMVPLFLELNEEQRRQFRSRGEIAASKIEGLLRTAGDVLREIVNVIREWLALLPGVNRFFIEREAKIKAEKIISLRQGGV